MLQSQDTFDESSYTSSAFKMADIGFDRSNNDGIINVANGAE